MNAARFAILLALSGALVLLTCSFACSVDAADHLVRGTVTPPPHASHKRDAAEMEDSYIYSTVIAGLTADPDTSVRDIRVDVHGQVVTLRGAVASPHVEQAAERIARDTAGVMAVRNFLTIKAGY